MNIEGPKSTTDALSAGSNEISLKKTRQLCTICVGTFGKPIHTAKSKKLEAYRYSLPLRVEDSVEELRKILRLTGWPNILLGVLNDSLSGGPGRPSTEVQLILS
ncbi:unnamed protein product [Nezara viridula]|uniref:Uncharacterized protein n=1 Tax=Nezara viridula TaxID=85310 RepID=A0A9P0HDK1_NEZVI|nr:unnamed protein product [Nezara viridula]